LFDVAKLSDNSHSNCQDPVAITLLHKGKLEDNGNKYGKRKRDKYTFPYQQYSTVFDFDKSLLCVLK